MSPRRPSPPPVVVRTLLVCAAMLVAPVALTALDLRRSDADLTTVPGVVLAALFALCGVMVFHVHVREEAYSFTLTELPMVVGLLLCDPVELLVARVVGEALALLVVPRQPWLKSALNGSLWLLETTVALTVVSLLGAPDPRSPAAWAVVFLAVVAADAVGLAVVHLVIWWHGGHAPLATVVPPAALTAVVNTGLGVVTVLVIQVHVASVLVLGGLAVLLVVGYRGYADVRQRYAHLRLLHDFSEAIGSATRPDEVIEAMLHHARVLLRAEVADLVVLPGTDSPTLRATSRGDEPLERRDPLPDVAFLREVATTGRSRLQARGQGRGPLTAYLDRLGCRDGLLVPLRLADGAHLLLGVAGRLGEVSTFDDEDRRLFETLASHAAMALEKGRLIDELRGEAARREHQALHDSLTGLPNRLRFSERAGELVAAASASGHRLAALLLDLDGFKDVNDTLGHHTGDVLLQEVGRRLAGAVRSDDVAARLGGDEFALLLDLGPAAASGAPQATAAALRLLDALEAGVRLDGVDLDVRASLGVALWPDHGADAAELLQRADVAMYQAKTARTRVAVYDADSDHHNPRRLQLATDLRRGIEERQLEVHYQPKADLASGAIVGAEALVRWQHPEHGRIGPDEFIPVAEQTGLITDLTYAVLREALADCRAWTRFGRDFGVAVNISVRSLLEPDFVPRVLAMLGRSGLSPSRLTLELTESSLMGDTRRSIDLLRQLADAGVRLSVDDFGTGYSSLAYLQRLPVTELKVDRSFVFEVAGSASDRAIVKSVIDLGHSLGLAVVAEGMENQLTWDVLVDLGCDTGQGYFLSRPLPAAELTAWLGVRGRERTRAA